MKSSSVNYDHTSSYVTLNELTQQTEYIWLVFHGMGYLSKYFIQYFNTLPTEQNYIIAPQAPSKYYQDSQFRRIGACWLTREETQLEMSNILNYIEAIYQKEIQFKNKKLVIMGYSQGVSIACRWMAHQKINASALILHSGSIPIELDSNDFSFLTKDTSIHLLYGEEDPYISPEKWRQQIEKADELFCLGYQVHSFKGVHEVHVPSLIQILDIL